MRLGLVGASPYTGNMGVSALFRSVITSLYNLDNEIEIVVFDGGKGVRYSHIVTKQNKEIKLVHCGFRTGRRYYLKENVYTMQLMSYMGKIGVKLNEGLRVIDSCDAILDISGGDSFSDIYGMKRFSSVYSFKKLAILRNKKLVLLPQTYGPYKRKKVLLKAEYAISKSTIAFARDEYSFSILKDILGNKFNSEKHFLGVDVAFSLEAIKNKSKIGNDILTWLNKDDNKEVVGLNINGLIFNNENKSRKQFNLKVSYKDLIISLVNKILVSTDFNILLVPHVMAPEGHYESDFSACKQVKNLIDKNQKNRIKITSTELNESEVKWVISNLSWFCGTRMHSTIAALSTMVPTAAISYSDKTIGVFKTCKQEQLVFDPRKLSKETMLDGLYDSLVSREKIKTSLEKNIPLIINKSTQQLQQILNII